MTVWQQGLPQRGVGLHPGYRYWLAGSGSLTARLVAASRQFEVCPCFEGLAKIAADEAAALGLAAGELAWVREVFLVCDGVPRVFARSVLPRSPRRGLDRLFRGLGSRSLGSMLFAAFGFVRAPLEFRRLDQRAPLLQRAIRATALHLPTAWARRSVFRQGDKSLLVAEVFLPAALQLPR